MALKDLITDYDGETLETGRVAAIVGIAAFIVLAAWGVIAQGKDFDMQAFGIGFGSLVGGLGVYLMGDKSKPKEHAPPGGDTQ
jgi:hypothetical protein